MRTSSVHSPASVPARSAAARSKVARVPVRAELPRLLRDASPGTRAQLLHSLQRIAGNSAVQQLIATVGQPGQTVAAGGGTGASVSLHGDTTSDYDGGTSHWAPRSMRRAASCTDCPDDQPCLHAVGTFSVTYRANVTIRMPDMPDGLSDCQQRRVRAFLHDVLAPHEREHARRFHTYDGTTRHPIDFTGCGTDALNAHLQEIHDTEEQQRHSDADALSAAIDPFNRTVDLDCT
jgi:hypothetical protein